jgi:hypothetical protein
MSFSLENYVDVPTRLTLALKKYPDLRIQETAPRTCRDARQVVFYSLHRDRVA